MDREAMASAVREAAGAVDAALADFPKGVTANLSPAGVALPRVRDALIVRLRGLESPPPQADSVGSAVERLADAVASLAERPKAAVVRAAIDRTNLCLSLVVGMQYPQGSAKELPLRQARELLLRLREDLERLPDSAPAAPAHRTVKR